MDDDGKWNAAVTSTAGVLLGCIGTSFAVVSLGGVEAKDWLQFGGTLLAGGMTLLAGALAWKGVLGQIQSDRELANAANDEAWKEALSSIKPLAERVSELEEIVCNANDEPFAAWLAIVVFKSTYPTDSYNEIVILSDNVMPTRRVKLRKAIAQFDDLICETEKFGRQFSSLEDLDANKIIEATVIVRVHCLLFRGHCDRIYLSP